MLTIEALSAISLLVLQWIGQAVIIGTVLALATWLVMRLAFRKAAPALVFAIWTVVLIKFVAPIGPAWSLSGAANQLRDWALPAATTVIAPTANDPARLRAKLIPITRGAETAKAKSIARWPIALCGCYLAGVALIAARRWTRYRNLVSGVWQMPEPAADVRALVARLSRQMRVRVPETRITSERVSPFVIGASRPVLVLTNSVLRRAEDLEAVILHELAHLRRGDLWVRRLQWLAGVLLFFWPIVAWVNRRIDLAREQACDEWALRHGRLSPAAYARCLLTVARDGTNAWRSAIPAAMAANPSHIERRIGMIMRSPARRPHGRRIGVVTGTLALGWCVFALSGAAIGAAKDGPEKSPEQKKTRIRVAQATADGAQAGTLTPAGTRVFVQKSPQSTVIRRQHVTTHGVPFLSDIPLIGNLFSSAAAAPIDTDIETHGPMMFAIELDDESPATLQAFMDNHPTADADADGAVTKVERDAYLVARAMARPNEVLAQYPAADRDGDGVLTPAEAARLVDGSGMWTPQGGNVMVMSRFVSGSPDATWQTADEVIELDNGAFEDAHAIMLDRPHFAIARVNSDDGAEVEVEELHGALSLQITEMLGDIDELDGAQNVEVIIEDGGADHAMASGECRLALEGLHDKLGALHTLNLSAARPASRWLEEEIDAEPTSADVAAYIDVVEAAPLETFLELNPDADTNGDGQLTADERDAFLHELTSRAHMEMLMNHPEMDIDGDGELTGDELADFFAAHDDATGGALVNVEKVRTAGAASRSNSVATMTSGDAKMTLTIDAARGATDNGEHTFTLTLDNQGATAFGKIRLMCRAAGGEIIAANGPGEPQITDGAVEFAQMDDLAVDGKHTFTVVVEAEGDKPVRLRANLRTDHGSIINDAELR